MFVYVRDVSTAFRDGTAGLSMPVAHSKRHLDERIATRPGKPSVSLRSGTCDLVESQQPVTTS